MPPDEKAPNLARVNRNIELGEAWCRSMAGQAHHHFHSVFGTADLAAIRKSRFPEMR
jgi:hypothetical protein